MQTGCFKKEAGQKDLPLRSRGKLLDIALIINLDGDFRRILDIIGDFHIACMHCSDESSIVVFGETFAELSGLSNLNIVLSRNIGDEAEVINLAAFEGAINNGG